MIKELKSYNYFLNITAIIISVLAVLFLFKDSILRDSSSFLSCMDIKISFHPYLNFFCLLPLLSIPVLIFSYGYFTALKYSSYQKIVIFLSIGAAILSFYLVVLSANLFTLFVGYELLTLCTIPLIITRYLEEEKIALKYYLAILIGTSTTMFLPALLFVHNIVGNTDFIEGGILANKLSDNNAIILLLLFLFGISKAALPPFYGWMMHAMVAPHPISAIIHGVLVVKAGVIALIKVILFTFGKDYITFLLQNNSWLLIIPAYGAIYSGLKALSENQIKRILAYSTISQLNFIILLALTIKDMTIVAHLILSHAILKVTLFLTAGYFYVKYKATSLQDISGVAKDSYLTSAIFLFVSFSMMGLPLMSGGIVKTQIIGDILEFEISTLIFFCSILTSSYLLKILYHMIFLPIKKTYIEQKNAPFISMKLGLLICIFTELFFITQFTNITTIDSLYAYKKFSLQIILALIMVVLSYVIKLDKLLNFKTFSIHIYRPKVEIILSQSWQVILLFTSLIIFMNI